MKRTWKVPTMALKRKSINLVKQGLRAGNSITKARKVAADTVGYTPGAVANWERNMKKTTTATNTKAKTADHSLITSLNVKSTTGAIVELTVDDVHRIAKLAGYIN